MKEKRKSASKTSSPFELLKKKLTHLYSDPSAAAEQPGKQEEITFFLVPLMRCVKFKVLILRFQLKARAAPGSACSGCAVFVLIQQMLIYRESAALLLQIYRT